MPSTLIIRRERPTDAVVVRHVLERAFNRAEEALVVGALHAARAITLALVAEDAGEVVGSIVFSPVWIDSHGTTQEAVGLGPMGVLPERQRQGVGSALVRQGLAELHREGVRAVVVLGHPAYYPRFGFVPASRFGLRWELGGAPEAFMACELVPGALRDCAGIVRYREEFAEL